MTPCWSIFFTLLALAAPLELLLTPYIVSEAHQVVLDTFALVRQLDETAVLRAADGQCAVQTSENRICQCQLFYPPVSSLPIFTSPTVRTLTRRRLDLLALARELCFDKLDAAEQALFVDFASTLCQFDQLPCNTEGAASFSSNNVKKPCQSSCQNVRSRVEQHQKKLFPRVSDAFVPFPEDQMVGESDEAFKMRQDTMTKLAQAASEACLQAFDAAVEFNANTGKCSEELFAETDCSPLPKMIPTYRQTQQKVHQCHAKKANCDYGAPEFDLPDAQQEKCIGPGGKLYPIHMSTSEFDASFRFVDGDIPQVKLRRASEANNPDSGFIFEVLKLGVGWVDFRLGSVYNLTGEYGFDQVYKIELEEAWKSTNPSRVFTCDKIDASGRPREINLTTTIPNAQFELTAQMFMVEKETTFELIPGEQFTVDPHSFKVTFYINGDVYQFEKHIIDQLPPGERMNTFAFGLSFRRPPYRGFVPRLHSGLGEPEDLGAVEDEIDQLIQFEGSPDLVRVRVPTGILRDGEKDFFYLYESGFSNVNALLAGRECPEIPFEYHMAPFQSSMKLDPSFSLLLGDQAVNTQDVGPDLAGTLPLEPNSEDEGLSGGAVAAIVIVVLLVIGAALGGIAFLRFRKNDGISSEHSSAM